MKSTNEIAFSLTFGIGAVLSYNEDKTEVLVKFDMEPWPRWIEAERVQIEPDRPYRSRVR